MCLATLDVCGYRDTVCKEIDLKSIGWEKKSIEVYPNPVSDILYLKSNGLPEQPAIIITDLAGNVVHRQFPQNRSVQAIEVSRLSAGVYILRYGHAYTRFVKR